MNYNKKEYWDKVRQCWVFPHNRRYLTLSELKDKVDYLISELSQLKLELDKKENK